MMNGGSLRIDAPTFTPNPWFGGLCHKMQSSIPPPPPPRSQPVFIPRSSPQDCLCEDDVLNYQGEDGDEESLSQHLLGSVVMNEIR
jgi:hypothetical protein